MTRSSRQFSPHRYEKELTALLQELLSLHTIDRASYERILRRHPKDGAGFFSKSDVIRGVRYLNRQRGWNVDEQRLLQALRMKPIRTQSGVAPVTVLTQPFPCPGRCIFCPSDVRMPKSYLSSEPGAQRAAHHRFDPYGQLWSRLEAYHGIGHDFDKVELIVLGGTWSSYPRSYQLWFTQRCFEAMNDFDDGGRARASHQGSPPAVDFQEVEPRVDGRALEVSYNQVVTSFLERRTDAASNLEKAAPDTLRLAQERNERARTRCVGFSIETRPDQVTADELLFLRSLGVTKVQIGYQSLCDEVLHLNQRGHDVAATRRAMTLLREAGFKIHAHWMPNLYGSSPQLDLIDFDRIFEDPDFRPDELKIYPCSLIDSAELMVYYDAGKWTPYSSRELLEVVTECLRRTPAYCRLTRVVRDIPGPEIVAGSRITNLRQVAEERLREQGFRGRDIRSREIRRRRVDPMSLRLERIEYLTSIGREVFLQLVTPEDRLVGFLRLSLPDRAVGITEIRHSAMIREVHIYGLLATIGQRRELYAQHLGLGTRLIRHAREIAARTGYQDLAVISSIGTRPYYRRLGFTDGELYQHLPV